MNFYGLNICITRAKLPAKIWRPKFVHGQHANAVEWFHNWYHVLNIRHLCLELFTNHMVCEARFLLLYLIDLTSTYVFWFDLDLRVRAKLLKPNNSKCKKWKQCKQRCVECQICLQHLLGLYVQSCSWCICLRNMLLSTEFSFIDSSVKLTETKASNPRDCNLPSPNARSQSSVNNGVLNVQSVYNIYWGFVSSRTLGVSACVTCYCQLNFPS